MKISIIVAIGNNGEIGLDNKMLWHVPEDFKSFKEITMGHSMVMGRKTFESIGKPLPGRTSIILSKSGYQYPGVETYESPDDIIEEAKRKNEEELFIIGGGEIYKIFLPFAERLYISHINYAGKADTYFPEIEKEEWKIAKEVSHESKEVSKGPIPGWKLAVYDRKYF